MPPILFPTHQMELTEDATAVLEWLRRLHFQEGPGWREITALTSDEIPDEYSAFLFEQIQLEQPLMGNALYCETPQGRLRQISFRGQASLEFLARNGVEFPGSAKYRTT